MTLSRWMMAVNVNTVGISTFFLHSILLDGTSITVVRKGRKVRFDNRRWKMLAGEDKAEIESQKRTRKVVLIWSKKLH